MNNYIRVKGNIPKQLLGYSNKQAFTLPGRYIDIINPRILFNGINYYLTFSIEEDTNTNIVPNSCKKYRDDETWQHKEYTEVIGIDFGCKRDNWLVASNGTKLKMPDLTRENRKLKKLCRKFQRQLKTNNERWEKANLSSSSSERPRTKNELKTLKQINAIEKRKTNKKKDALECFLSHNILACKPKAVVIEDIYARNMYIADNNISKYKRNIHNYAVINAMPSIVKTTILRKMKNNNTPTIVANMYYPSSKICSCCGHKLDIGLDRIYKCPICGMVKDRDENASDNLKNYGQSILLGIN